MKSVAARNPKLVHGADRLKEITERIKSEWEGKNISHRFAQINADHNLKEIRPTGLAILIRVYLRKSVAY